MGEPWVEEMSQDGCSAWAEARLCVNISREVRSPIVRDLGTGAAVGGLLNPPISIVSSLIAMPGPVSVGRAACCLELQASHWQPWPQHNHLKLWKKKKLWRSSCARPWTHTIHVLAHWILRIILRGGF